MATVQEPRPASRHDAFVETQLARARGRIRSYDVAVAAVAQFLYLRPAQFFSLLGRAFAPFGQKAIATRTRLTLVRPPAGDLTVPINTSVEIRVSVEGRVPSPEQPDALRLRFRYNP